MCEDKQFCPRIPLSLLCASRCGVWKNTSSCGSSALGNKEKETPMECCFLKNCYSPEPCVQVEARMSLKELMTKLSTGAAQSVPKPRAKAGVDVQISQGEGNLGDIWSLGVIYSFIFLLSNYYAPGTVLATVKQE